MLSNTFTPSDFNLEPGEQIISVMRKHWFVLFVSILPALVLFFLPLIIFAFLDGSHLTGKGVVIISYFTALWMLVMLAIMFVQWTIYYLDIWIVTNKRIVDIEQVTLFNREIRTLHMLTVQDVRVDVVGIFETLLHFGTLRVQTAGTGGTDAKIVGIPYPEMERDIIMKLLNQIHNETTQLHNP